MPSPATASEAPAAPASGGPEVCDRLDQAALTAKIAEALGMEVPRHIEGFVSASGRENTVYRMEIRRVQGKVTARVYAIDAQTGKTVKASGVFVDGGSALRAVHLEGLPQFSDYEPKPEAHVESARENVEATLGR